MKKLTFFLVGVCLFGMAMAKVPPPNAQAPATLQEVTVYRTSAELVHEASAKLNAGSGTLVISGISSHLDINSIQVNCPAVVTILSTEFSNNFLNDENLSPELLGLRDSMQQVNVQLETVKGQIKTAEELIEVLQANKEVSGGQAGLSVAELTKMMAYYETKANEVRREIIALQVRLREIQTQSTRLNAQITEEQKKNTRSGGRLTLNVNTAVAGTYKFTITYITYNAQWVPYYDIRSENIRSPLKFELKAKIAQTTGIDWNKVNLAISTSSPAQYGNAPVLKSWFLSYVDPYRYMQENLSKANTIPGALQGRVPGVEAQEGLQEVVVTGYGRNRNGNATPPPVFVVNGTVMSRADFEKIDQNVIANSRFVEGEQAEELYGAGAAGGATVVTLKESLSEFVEVANQELDMVYQIDLPYDVPSNGKPQIATLVSTNVPATYKYYAVPKLDRNAYLLAEVPNWQQLNLVSAEANIIFEGTYVGKTIIDATSTLDTLNLTLGVDKRIAVSRVKLQDYSSTRFIGSNKLQQIGYEITVRNNRTDAIEMIVKDQYPISMRKEIEVNLENADNASVNKEIGVLTWQFNLPAGQSRKMRMEYSVKYPRDRVLNLN